MSNVVNWSAGINPQNRMGVVSQQLAPGTVYQVGGDPHIFFSGTFIYSGSAQGNGVLYLQFGYGQGSWVAFTLNPGQAITIKEAPLNAIMVSNNYFTVIGALFWVDNIDRMKPEVVLPSTSITNAIITSPLTASGNLAVGIKEDDIGLITDLNTLITYASTESTQLSTLITYTSASLVFSTTNASLTTSTGVSITAPATGTLILQFAFNSSAVPEVVIAGATTSLNSGNAIAANALYEFAIHVNSGDTITLLANASVTALLVRAFFRHNA